MNKEKIIALVDTGGTTSPIKSCLVAEWHGKCEMVAFDGSNVTCLGMSEVNMEIDEKSLSVTAMVVDNIVGEIKAVIGMDIISRLGGVSVGNKDIVFGKNICSMVADTVYNDSDYHNNIEEIEDKDFSAKFDGEVWTVSWKWKEGGSPVLKNKVECYKQGLVGDKKEAFETEIDRWIEEGILVPWKEDVDEGILALMAVEQATKGKIRPVLDYREMNEYVESHTGDDITDICGDRLREWRMIEGEAEMVDLKSAYLQIRVAPELWKYQLVKYKGQTFCLTRLGFGLNSAPRIMSKILKTVLSYSTQINDGTSSYIDDIIVNKSKVETQNVIQHLKHYGLLTKPPESLENGAVLGLKLNLNQEGNLVYRRGNKIPLVTNSLTRKELFSVCGKLVGHYPVAGWLRVACSYIKRRAGGSGWNDSIGEKADNMIRETVSRVENEDPVKGLWSVPKKNNGRVWCDASDLALGVILEVDGVVAEDAAWLRKKTDYNHINVAELEAVLKGVNLAVKWGLETIEIVTDSATVHRWIELTLSEERKIKSKGAAEIIVKRRLGILKVLVDELSLNISVVHVASKDNKADALTRVKQKWLEKSDKEEIEVECCAAGFNLKDMHNTHHMGVERSLFLARRLDPTVSKEDVKKVVRECEQCQKIDPAPTVHEAGELYVGNNWERLAIDVTHYRNTHYLSIVDCGPGRFAIWRELKHETAECIVTTLEQIFYERGPVTEVLMDNATVFRSEKMLAFLGRWYVRPCFRAAYRPSGNGIVKGIIELSKQLLREAVLIQLKQCSGTI